MRGINGSPFVDLDGYVDISVLPLIENEIRRYVDAHGLIPMRGFYPVDYRIHNFYYKNHLLVDDFYTHHAEYPVWRQKPLDNILVPNGLALTLRAPASYMQKHISGLCKNREHSKEFPILMEWIKTLPMSEIGRIVLFIQEPGNSGVIHADYSTRIDTPCHDEFIWFRPNGDKKFFIIDENNEDKKYYLNSYVTFFNVMDYHGTDIADKTNFSVRVDGRFTDYLRTKIHIDPQVGW